MSITKSKRSFAVFTAVFLIAFLLLSPFAELYGIHDHSCSPDNCLICLVSNALSELRTSIGALFCATAIFLFTYVCEAMRRGEYLFNSSSPVALKTKITS